MDENLISLCRKHHTLAEAGKIQAAELRRILTYYFDYQYDDLGRPLTYNGKPIQEA